MQILRVATAIANWSFISNLPLNVPPTFFVFSGLVWSVAGIGLLAGFWMKKPWIRKATIGCGLAYTAFHWLDRFFLQEPGPQSANMPFDLLVTVLLLIFVITTMALPQSRAYFGAEHG
ncbi:MAG TPA: hypothetical protein VLK33_01670 [Terriglobales bacterium]|nr:hypothetical protein [Terriglobales bacterium]